jgi:hypothetical protein
MSPTIARRLLRVAELLLEANPYRGWETRREREEAVTVNLPPELIPYWERTKAQFKGTPEQRLKAFLDYAHDHPDDAMEAVEHSSDRKLQQMIRQRERQTKPSPLAPSQKGYPSFWDDA